MEFGEYKLTDVRGMRDLLPFIRINEENKRFKKNLYLLFLMAPPDLVPEAFAIVLRFALEGKICAEVDKTSNTFKANEC